MKYLQRCIAAFLLPLSGAMWPVQAQSQQVAGETPAQWDARWITSTEAAPALYGVYLFRKTFTLTNYSGPFLIHLTADNRYRLYVNGRFVAMGPARSDLANWYYETLDLSAYLKYGTNVIAAEVINYGPDKPRGQLTQATGLLIQGHTAREAAIINTGSTPWQTMEDGAVYCKPVITAPGAFYGAYPGDSIVAEYHPWDWQEATYNDSCWDKAAVAAPVTLQGTSALGWRMLSPRPVGPLQHQRENFTRIAEQEGVTVPADFLKGIKPLTIPAQRKIRLLLDRGQLTTGFPELLLSGGLDASVRITYRAPYNNETIVQDVIRPDGGNRRKFTPVGYRTFRYVQLDIETGKSSLTLEDYYNVYTQYGLTEKAAFSASPETDTIWQTARRIAFAGAQDNLYNDLWQEQLQYIQDAHIHGLGILYFSGDGQLLRNALRQFDQSRIPEGLIRTRYPADDMQVSVAAAFDWIVAIQDYLLFKEDKALAKQLYPGVRNILDWFARYRDAATGLPGNMPYRDSAAIAPLTFQYLYSLRQAAAIAGYCDKPADSTAYVRIADKLREVVYRYCFDAGKGLYAETAGKKTFSRYTNAMAVLAEAVPPRQVKNVMQRMVKEKALPEESLRDKFYIFRAMQETGTTGTFQSELAPWHPVQEENSSLYQSVTCVANIYLLGITAGIQSTSYGFKTALIAPAPGNLKQVNAAMPHPDGGMIEVALNFDDNRVSGTVTLPFGITGKFRWRGKETVLHGGPQHIEM
ncbi:alpha-L-rhamnosidase C-terminal domain-containing protein [Chitinophaga sp. MM2321]|uniref:alpha-L-rhamnosidase-related protein n=1 Tax=Chitinophaga sp. MM2321 TaxID=3137178 RepID=UPI0032D57992